jgi:signal transduction histidine kinase
MSVRPTFRSVSPAARLALALTVILVPLAALIALQAYQALGRTPKLVRSREMVSHTFEVMASVQDLASSLQDAERGQRGYLMTRERPYLEAYLTAAAAAPLQLAKLRDLTADNREQQRRMPQLKLLLDGRLADMQRTLDVFEREGFEAAQRLVRTNAGLNAMQALRAQLGTLEATERELLAGRIVAAAQEERSTAYAALASGLLAFALMVVGVLLTVLAFKRARDLEIERRATERQLSERLSVAQAALAQTQKMEALGQLTGGVAHDFNNLLHVIRNALAIVQRRLRSPDADLTQYLEMAKRNTDRAASTTSRLLAFSRQQPLDPQPTDLNRLISSMAELLRHTIGEHVAMETVLGSGLWAVAVDRNQLETAILNLAVNARDAMPRSGKLTIETANTFLDEAYVQMQGDVSPGQYAMIAVSDTGSGMTPEVAMRAFDPFFTTKKAGTGLGLSQVFGFLKQSGGHIKIYSEPEEGTTVKIYLPRLLGAAAVQARAGAAVPGTGAGESILVVEDDEDVRTFTAHVLGELGYQVAVAPDGQRALGVLEQLAGVDLLFTDVGLPEGMSGRALADEALRRWPSMRVLYTSGYARNSIVHHGRLDAGVELITKPFSRADLALKIRQVLDGHGAAGTSPRDS